MKSSTRQFSLVSLLVLMLLMSAALLPACQTASTPTATLRIVSGSENNTLEPIIQEWASANNVAVEMTYMGSLDIARMLQSGEVPYDAVWPANRLWLDYGDTHNMLKHDQSIMRSPVVFAVKRSVADRLGWIGRDVTMEEILTATESGEVQFMMTSATQSNSGASFYFGALNAFAGNPTVITSEDLHNPDVRENITRILGSVDRSSGSSGWLKDLFLQQYDRYDAMVNYESVVIEANTALTQSGREPLYAVYPVDGLTIADSPLAYVDHSNAAAEQAFLALQQHLMSEGVQQQLLEKGRRATLVGVQLENVNSAIFNPDWGIDVNRVLQPIRFPSRDVISEALNFYQVAFRRPSCTAYVLDFSGSMASKGEDDLKAAMRTLLEQDIASQYLLQGHPGDVSTVVLFNDVVLNGDTLDQWTVAGNDPEPLHSLQNRIQMTNAGGGTNIFDSVRTGLQQLRIVRTPECLPAVIVMTDGQDNKGNWNALAQYIQSNENDIPVFAITFGDADTSQLEPLTTMTYGRIFNGQADLVRAFREAKGYN